jgi:heat shock protein HslJ
MLSPVIAAFAALVFVAACGPAPVTTQPSEPPAAIDPAGPWELESGTLADQPLALVAGAPITLVVEGSQVSGRSACNQYFGEFAIVDGKVTLGGLGGTEMACEEPIMTLEAAYLSALAKVDSARMDGSALVLTGPLAELRFERLEPPPTAEMIGTHWLLESIVQADVASSPVGVQPTLLLNADGTLQGSTGCRRLTGRYVIDGAEIRPTDFAAEGACTDDVFVQDSQVIEILGDGFRAALVGRKLQITSPGGVWGLVYRATE